MVFSNHTNNQANNRKDNNSRQNNKAHKQAMSRRWTSMIQYHSDDKTNPAEAGFFFYAIDLLLKAIAVSSIAASSYLMLYLFPAF